MAMKHFAISGVMQPGGYDATYTSLGDYIANEAGNLVSLGDNHIIVLYGDRSQRIQEVGQLDFSGFTTGPANLIQIVPEMAYSVHGFIQSNMITVVSEFNGPVFNTGDEYIFCYDFAIENTRSINPNTNATTINGNNTYLHRMLLQAAKPLNETATTTMELLDCVCCPNQVANSYHTTYFNGDNINNCLIMDTLDMGNQGGANTVTNVYAMNWANTGGGGNYSYNAGITNVPGMNAVLITDESLVFVAGSGMQACVSTNYQLIDGATNPLYGAGMMSTNIGPDVAYEQDNKETSGTLVVEHCMTGTRTTYQEFHASRDGYLSAPAGTTASTVKYQSEDHYTTGTTTSPQKIVGSTYRFDERATTGVMSIPIGMYQSTRAAEHRVLTGKTTQPSATQATVFPEQTRYVGGTISVPVGLQADPATGGADDDTFANGLLSVPSRAVSSLTKNLIPQDYSVGGSISVPNSTSGLRITDTDGYNDLGEAICLDALWNATIELDGEMNVCQKKQPS